MYFIYNNFVKEGKMATMIKNIKNSMVKKGIPEEIISQIDFSEKFDNHSSDLFNSGEVSREIMRIINQMDKLLTKEQCLLIMEDQGCCTTGKPAKAHIDFGRKYSKKSIVEKINLFDKLETQHKYSCKLNEDQTLSVHWDIGNEGNYICVCKYINKLHDKTNISKTFCGCCGAHARKICKDH